MLKTKYSFALVMFLISILIYLKTNVVLTHNNSYLIGLLWGIGSGIFLCGKKWFDE